MIEDLDGEKAEFDLTKSQNSEVNNEREKLFATEHTK